MKIDFSATINDLDDKPITQGEKGKEEVLTLKIVATTALLNPKQGIEPSPDEAVKKFSLAMSIHQAKGPVDVKAEEIVLMKSAIGAIFAPLVVGRAFQLLDK